MSGNTYANNRIVSGVNGDRFKLFALAVCIHVPSVIDQVPYKDSR